ncbi:MAG: NAD(P)/FAD-dependent oxidoreductase, partial [Pseudomonadota bacterium]
FKTDTDTYVLIVGGGQSGLALGAQLSHLNVPYRIIDKYLRIGDQWRSRYDSLVLHDPVWYDHLPFRPYPESWPVFTPKDQMGDWLDNYAVDLGLNISTNTTLTSAVYDNNNDYWQASLVSNGKQSDITATHLVMATGLSGFAHQPTFEGQDLFTGRQCHSSEFRADTDMQGTNVVVVGANNSAHDIAADLVGVGAKPVMIQRSSTLVVKQSVYCNQLLGKLYSKQALGQGITADEADFLFTSVPMRLLEQRHRELWKQIQYDNKAFYQKLTEAGFILDFAEDGTGLGLKYRRTASGYYIDVGASDMVIDGRIAIRSGVSIECLTENAVQLSNGETLPADAVVYATGYGNMVDWVAALINKETAQRVGPCWGYGSSTKGDPGPWQGELRNMWKPTAQRG